MDKMIKPIFTIGVPQHGGEEALVDMREHIEEKITDYHVLVYSHIGHDIKFQCF